MDHALPSPARSCEPAPPRLPGWEHGLALLADPYRFIGRGARQLGSDVFEARLLLRPTICLTGSPAAALFYDGDRFQRDGAAPEPLKATLFGRAGVQGLDGDAHRVRKALFVTATGPQAVARLVREVDAEWDVAAAAWVRHGRPLSLYRACQPLLTRAVFRWAGVPLAEAEVGARTRELVALFDGAASGPLAHLHARWARGCAERRLAAWFAAARDGRVELPPGSAAQAIAGHRDAGGRALAPRTAACELLNLLRPVVAVSLWITFVAHALHRHPNWRGAVAEAGTDGPLALGFVSEVRRDYPFFPALVARVRQDFAWRGLHFAAGRRTLLDIHGTNHDARVWDRPLAFRPDRWLHRRPGPFDFIAQGGGDVAAGHRCPGEDVATQLMRLALRRLLAMRYEVPPQDLSLRMRRLPALPGDAMVLRVTKA